MIRLVRFGSLSRYKVGDLFALALLLCGASPAAAQRCSGSYAATALHPLPEPAIIGLDIRDPSPEHQRLAVRFLQGMRDAGAKVDGTPNALLSINYSVFGLDLDRRAGSEGSTYSDFGTLSGGLDPSVPSASRMRLRPPSHPHAPVTLSLRAEATKLGSSQVVWVLSLQCQMDEQNPSVLAYDVGQMVGQSIGRTVPRRAF